MEADTVNLTKEFRESVESHVYEMSKSIREPNWNGELFETNIQNILYYRFFIFLGSVRHLMEDSFWNKFPYFGKQQVLNFFENYKNKDYSKVVSEDKTEKAKSIKKEFAREVNDLVEKYNAMMSGEFIFLIGHRNVNTGYYTIDGMHSQPGKTFKDVYVLWRTQPLDFHKIGPEETKRTG